MSTGHSDVLIYGDFACARCYLASQKADALVHRGALISWRAVEQNPHLAVAGRQHDAATRADLDQVLAVLRPRLRGGEVLPERIPGFAPKSQAAVSAYAEACGAHVADEIRGSLFTAYWLHGTNIGDPEVLRTLLAAEFLKGDATSAPIREFGYAVAMTRSPITGAAWRRVRDWRRQWLDLGAGDLPVVSDGQRVEVGDAGLAWLDDVLDQEPAPARAPVRSWRPPTTAIPPATWTTQIGDPWQRAWQLRQVDETLTQRQS
ncbi:hypothetical protein [Leekyejoonella antrihumi]|uniref:DSBA-like thioredoxin domain-containing protein n=1 Tax=Leekyejoonella antrihumi TaxID=1660198 RepID=A0A563E0W6_9MICO|nr:hypothetical protein [Leekyejoonella antrihumi]TWP35812.1 hypothetical protein FGL98_12450 [Leekyejoonella antrihumi]